MWLSDKWADYELLDCSRGEKLERWGNKLLVRPDSAIPGVSPKTASRHACC
jgi:23S rRNA (cytosine1962-C5)-methyltransferase